MLYKVEARTAQGALLTLPLQDVSNGIIVKNIDGLDPVDAVLVSSSFARIDGEQYHGSRRVPRNLKFKLGMEPIYGGGTVADIRQNLYQFFMPKREINLRFFMTTGLTVDISGRVESSPAPMFSREPTMDISIVCHKPDLLNLTPAVVSGVSSLLTTRPFNKELTYNGTVEGGIVLTVNVDRTLNEFTFYHETPDGSLWSMDFAAPLLTGDVLTISTIPGSKFATLLRGSTVSSILRGVSPYANWIAFENGLNRIRLYTEGISGVPYSIQYIERYGGL